jgi:hypothetical protein
MSAPVHEPFGPPPAGDDGWRQPHRSVIAVVVVVLCVIGVSTFAWGAADASSQKKAEQLQQELTAAGLRAPSDTEAVVRVLGNDGGVVCDDPGGALRKAALDAGLSNGAAFVGQRPVQGAKNLVQAELIVLQVYCPDVADDFRQQIEDYRLDDTVKE